MKINRFTTQNTLLSIILLISFLIPFQTTGTETPNNCDLLNKTARLHFVKGEYGETAKYLDRALKINPNHLQSLLLTAELHLRKFEFNHADKYLDKVAALDPQNISLQLLQAQSAEKKMDFKTSETIYRKLLKKNPQSIHALYGMAKTFHYLNRFDESETYIKKCYQTDPQFGGAYLLHSKIHRMRQDNDAWKKNARKAMELSPFDADARVAYARTLMRGEGKLNEGAEQAKIALKTDPYSLSAHHYFGRGYTAVPYKEYTPQGDKKTAQKITQLYQQGDRHLVKGEYAKADQAFTSLLKLDPRHIRTIIGKGAVHFHQKEYDTALDLFFRALKINPDYGLAHYSVTLVLQKRLDQVNVRFPELEKRFEKTGAPTLPYLEDVFINYHQCSTGLQKIIRLTAAPLGNYMKALKIAGATVYFMDIHQFLWESPGMRGIKGQRTFDLRLWDDVKGSGSYNCISNKSQQADVKYLRFNIAGHEFAHLVQQVLNPGQRTELRRLYLKAKKERITLDWYADMNDWEYFAVGYEAFISEEKLPGQSDVYAHTRKELLKKDPGLYRFIEGLNKAADYRENEIMGLIMKANYSTRDPEKRIEIFKEGLAAYGNHLVLLNALAGDYNRQKNHDAAFKTYQKAIETFPGDSEAYLEIAIDIFDREKNTGKAIAFLKKHEARLSNDAGYFFHLGTMYYYAGEIDKMETAMRAGLKLDPWPDIYSPNYFKGDPYFILAKGKIAKKDYKEAEKNLLISLEKINRNFAEGWAELAAIYLETGRITEGKTHLDTALRLRPDNPRVKEVNAAYRAKEGK